jgi:hypothetical protein
MTDADSELAKFLVELLALSEKEGIVRINREWLAKQRGQAAKPEVTT